MINLNVTIDWKFVVALGVAPSCFYLATKIDADAAERVLTQASKVYVAATSSIN